MIKHASEGLKDWRIEYYSFKDYKIHFKNLVMHILPEDYINSELQ